MVALITCLLCYIFGVILGIQIDRGKYLNSNVYYPVSCGGIKPVKFYVIKVEEAFDTNHNLIAKYTVEFRFFSKEDNKGYKIYNLKFYDSPSKYNIGDTLTLITYNE